MEYSSKKGLTGKIIAAFHLPEIPSSRALLCIPSGFGTSLVDLVYLYNMDIISGEYIVYFLFALNLVIYKANLVL